MNKRYVQGTIAAAGLIFILACITINIYFPEATVRKAADQIVDEIRKQAEEKKAPDALTACPEASSFSLVPAAYGQEETNVSTPGIRVLKEAMKVRFAALQPFFNGGNIGETNTGMIDVRDEAGLGLQDKATLRKLVKDENSDRTKLYAEVAKALGIDAGQVDRIGKIFAGSWINAAAPGWWIQKEDGSWIKKS
jgi:uncharacterized protein YdbL (DUF1318 family)